MINFALAPYFQEFIQLILTDASFYVPCFDESHNSTLKKGQVDLHVRFWDNSSNIVQTRYLISCLMGKATAQDVYDNFKECFTSVDDKKIIQVSSDGPNVNHKFLNLMRGNRKKTVSQSCVSLIVSVLLKWILKVLPFTNALKMLMWELLPSL